MGTTPIYGFPYPDPSDLVANYPALGQDLAEDIEAVLPTIGGLAPVAPTTIANSGGTATFSANTVTFSAVNSVSLNGIFSATYTNYRITISAVWNGSTSAGLLARTRNAGTDATGASAYEYILLLASDSSGPSRSYQAAAQWTLGTIGDRRTACTMDVTVPFTSDRTVMSGITYERSTGDARIDIFGANQATGSSHDGMTFYPASNSMTGVISVYGYKA
jgi:hypothetical protein